MDHLLRSGFLEVDFSILFSMGIIVENVCFLGGFELGDPSLWETYSSGCIYLADHSFS